MEGRIINLVVVDKGIWKSKPCRYTVPQGQFFCLEIWNKTLRAFNHELGTAAEKEIMIKKSLRRHEDGVLLHVSANSKKTDRRERLGEEFLWFLFNLGELPENTILYNCIHMWKGSWDSCGAGFLCLHQIPVSKKSFLLSTETQSLLPLPALSMSFCRG